MNVERVAIFVKRFRSRCSCDINCLDDSNANAEYLTINPNCSLKTANPCKQEIVSIEKGF